MPKAFSELINQGPKSCAIFLAFFRCYKCKVVLDDALRFMEDEMSVLDEEERLENPPRKAITA